MTWQGGLEGTLGGLGGRNVAGKKKINFSFLLS
jgi:hypothetical protein